MGNEIEIKSYKINEKFENYGKFLFALSIFFFLPFTFLRQARKEKAQTKRKFCALSDSLIFIFFNQFFFLFRLGQKKIRGTYK